MPLTLLRTTTERVGTAMEFVLSCWGMRGDVEPSAAVGRELVRRGHEVRMGCPAGSAAPRPRPCAPESPR
jgi:hypothetical protein